MVAANTAIHASLPDNACIQLGLFAAQEAAYLLARTCGSVGTSLSEEALEARFEAFAACHAALPGIAFLAGSVLYVRDALGLSAGDFLLEMTRAILAHDHPAPQRRAATAEILAAAYLVNEMQSSSVDDPQATAPGHRRAAGSRRRHDTAGQPVHYPHGSVMAQPPPDTSVAERA